VIRQTIVAVAILFISALIPERSTASSHVYFLVKVPWPNAEQDERRANEFGATIPVAVRQKAVLEEKEIPGLDPDTELMLAVRFAAKAPEGFNIRYLMRTANKRRVWASVRKKADWITITIEGGVDVAYTITTASMRLFQYRVAKSISRQADIYISWLTGFWLDGILFSKLGEIRIEYAQANKHICATKYWSNLCRKFNLPTPRTTKRHPQAVLLDAIAGEADFVMPQKAKRFVQAFQQLLNTTVKARPEKAGYVKIIDKKPVIVESAF
jgi:hypothetical protein